MKERVFIIDAARTPIGKFGGTLKDIDPSVLAAMLITGLLKRTGIEESLIEQVHLGCCCQCAEKDAVGPVIARQALLKAGLSPYAISSTIDRACTSSTWAFKTGFDAIMHGEAKTVIVGGTEVMSKTPYILRSMRWGAKAGSVQAEDPILPLGYKDYNPVSVDASNIALEYDVSRQEQDEWAYQSQKRYQIAKESGRFKNEIIPILIHGNKGIQQFEEDEFPKPDTTLEKLSQLNTIFNSKTITAGNAPGLNDGASAIILMSESQMACLKLKPLAEVICFSSYADSADKIASVPGDVINKALNEAHMTYRQIDLFEINEAFAAMPLVATKIIGNNDNVMIEEIRCKTNVNGGAIAIGHPVGASGTRIIATLAHELKQRGGGYGIAAICGGLAQGDAVIIKV